MKDNTAAMETLQKATEADVEKKVSSGCHALCCAAVKS